MAPHANAPRTPTRRQKQRGGENVKELVSLIVEGAVRAGGRAQGPHEMATLELSGGSTGGGGELRITASSIRRSDLVPRLAVYKMIGCGSAGADSGGG